MSDKPNQQPNTPTIPTLQYLLIMLGEREYGIRLDHLQEVMRYNPYTTAPVPNTFEWLEGIMSLRGTIISIVNLRVFFQMPRFDPAQLVHGKGSYDFGLGFSKTVQRLLVAYKDDLQIGFLVDDIKGVLNVQPNLIDKAAVIKSTEPDIIRDYLEGVYKDPETNKITNLIQIRSLVTSPQLLLFEPLETV